MSVDHIELSKKYARKELSGQDLAAMVADGTITKADRRKICKFAVKPPKAALELTARQLLRQQVKEKKSLPRMSKEERRAKFCTNQLEEEREAAKSMFLVCLGCRKRGHMLKNCPNAHKVSLEEKSLLCFNCGSTFHALRNCPEPQLERGVLPFATCFICKQRGHLSRDCPENANGLYPNGGCCHICLQKTHLVKDCPEKPPDDRKRKFNDENELYCEEVNVGNDTNTGGDDLGYDLDAATSREAEEEEDDDSDSDRPKKKKSKKDKKDKKDKKQKK
jgi:cofilin